MTYRLAFTEDPAELLSVAAAYLAADPVVTTVVSSVTERAARDAAEGTPTPAHPRWWVSVHDSDDGDRVVGVAMRTAPFVPFPMYVLPMPDEAARTLADVLVARREDLTGVNGALPAAQVIAESLAQVAGGTAQVDTHMRLHVLGELVDPPPPTGRMRAATPDDAAHCLDWFRVFDDEAAAQAGRPHGHGGEHVDLAQIEGKVDRREVWLWEDSAGLVVHLTAHNPPSFGVARVGPVYTPGTQRGHGYASATVAGVSRMLREGGAEVCLFTDQANPTSNKIYAAIGYEPVVDMANFDISPGITRPARA